VELLADAAAVDIEEVEDPAAIGSTEAIATVLDVGVVELVLEVEVDDEVVEVLDDAAAEVDEVLVDAVDDVVNGIAGVGGASKRMNRAKLVVSGLLSDTVLPLLIASTVLTVSSGRGLGEHCGEALEFRLLGNKSLVTPSSTLYASPANISMDMFCAFHPNRVIFPVLPLRLNCAEMPSDALCWAWAETALWRLASEMPSTNPSPNVFIGMRKITLFAAT
jgi:hypothetical protein